MYASSRQLAEADPWVVHAIKTRAFVDACSGLCLAAGWSAAVLRGLPMLRKPPAIPTVIQQRPTRRGTSRTPYGLIRVADVPEGHRTIFAGCPVVGTAWMTVDIARTADRPSSIVLADAVLHRGISRRALGAARALMRGWPGAQDAAWVVVNADGRAESALESLGRLTCIDGGLPVPLSNVWVGPGYPLHRLDHLWPYHWVAAEGDGALKYRGRDPAGVVKAEKQREWALRRLGLEVVRYDWELAAYRREELAGRFGAVLEANSVRTEPVLWWPTQSPFVGQDGSLADEFVV